MYVLLVEVSHLEGFSKYLGYFIAPLFPMLPTSTLFCAKEMETKIRPAFAHFSLRAKKISKMEDYRSSVDCFLSVFSGLVLWINLGIKIFHIINPFLEIFLPIVLRQTNISANSIHPKNACLLFLDIFTV